MVIGALMSSEFSERMFANDARQRASAGIPNFAAIVTIMFDPTPENVLAPAIGAALERVEVQWHVAAGHDDSLIRFWLTFAGVETFGFHVGADGEVLDVIPEAPGADADMGQYGRLEVRPALAPDPPAVAVGQRLVGVQNLFDVYGESVIGARLDFESAVVSVADWEDELQWASGDLPGAIGARPR
jgi:hypothetical protein